MRYTIKIDYHDKFEDENKKIKPKRIIFVVTDKETAADKVRTWLDEKIVDFIIIYRE